MLGSRQAVAATLRFLSLGQKAQAIGQCDRFLAITRVVFTAQAFPGLTLTARCGLFPALWGCSTVTAPQRRVNSYNSFADVQEPAW